MTKTATEPESSIPVFERLASSMKSLALGQELVMEPEPKITVYISIGNSDDKLTQKLWSEFHLSVSAVIAISVDQVHGKWTSDSVSPWQNACWCVELYKSRADSLKRELAILADQYGQESIAWAEAPSTEFIEPS